MTRGCSYAGTRNSFARCQPGPCPRTVKQADREGCAQRLAETYEDAFHQEFGTPLDRVTANELRWF